MWYKIKRICIKKWKFCIVVNFFIWIVIKNYWCDIKKNEKSENILMISSEKYKKMRKKVYKQYCNVLFWTNKAHVSIGRGGGGSSWVIVSLGPISTLSHQLFVWLWVLILFCINHCEHEASLPFKKKKRKDLHLCVCFRFLFYVL